MVAGQVGFKDNSQVNKINLYQEIAEANNRRR